MHKVVPMSSAHTDVSEFISDLDGGQLERMLSAALSETAAAVVDNKKKGLVSITFSLEPIAGTSQVHIAHQLKYSRPTEDGKRSEEANRSTPMHVGKFGKLSLSPENQLDWVGRTERAPTATAQAGSDK